MVKGEIAATVEDNVESRTKSNGGRYFSREELHELFALNLVTTFGGCLHILCHERLVK